MDNTKANITKFNTNAEPQIAANPFYISNQQSLSNVGAGLVFWQVNLIELFGVTETYPGMAAALNLAFNAAKSYVPVDSGITKRSMTQKVISPGIIMIYFDPAKVIGQDRYGRMVTDYYVAYIAEHASRLNWLSICMHQYYESLFASAKALLKKQNNQSTNPSAVNQFSIAGMTAFMMAEREQYKQKKEEAKQAKKQEEMAKKAKQKALEDKKKRIHAKYHKEANK